MNLGFKTPGAGGTRAFGDHVDRRPSDAGTALFRDDRKLGDDPAIVSDSDGPPMSLEQFPRAPAASLDKATGSAFRPA